MCNIITIRFYFSWYTFFNTKHSIPQSLIRVSFDSGNGTGAFEEIGFEFGAVEVGIAAINQPPLHEEGG